jgi:hypothetical protein
MSQLRGSNDVVKAGYCNQEIRSWQLHRRRFAAFFTSIMSLIHDDDSAIQLHVMQGNMLIPCKGMQMT